MSLCYSSCVAQTVTDFADASHSKSAKSATTTVSYGIFSSENSYPCTVTSLNTCPIIPILPFSNSLEIVAISTRMVFEIVKTQLYILCL